MVLKRAALDENSKNQIFANDIVRRLANTDVRQNREVIGQVVDQFGKKILTSGYTLRQTRKIVLNGIRGWERKKERALKENRKLFRTSKELKRRLWGDQTGLEKEEKVPRRTTNPRKRVENNNKVLGMEERMRRKGRTKN